MSQPSSTIAQVEIFGPVLVTMTFRTPEEAVALANNTPYGLAASVWTENINLALDIAPKIKAGVVWINSHELVRRGRGVRRVSRKRFWTRRWPRGDVGILESGKRRKRHARSGEPPREDARRRTPHVRTPAP